MRSGARAKDRRGRGDRCDFTENEYALRHDRPSMRVVKRRNGKCYNTDKTDAAGLPSAQLGGKLDQVAAADGHQQVAADVSEVPTVRCKISRQSTATRA